MQRQQLPTRDQFGSGVVGRLHVEQEPSLAENLGHIDDVGRFLVNCFQIGVAALDESARIMTRQRLQRVGLNRVAPLACSLVVFEICSLRRRVDWGRSISRFL
jgi:hypothetical protein